jgi:hypothetical protein
MTTNFEQKEMSYHATGWVGWVRTIAAKFVNTNEPRSIDRANSVTTRSDCRPNLPTLQVIECEAKSDAPESLPIEPCCC